MDRPGGGRGKDEGADLYRRTRVQEAVYDTLTKQHELAKVEEATETPSVKVLDLAHVPERKSFPREWSSGPGLYLFSLVWVSARAGWQDIVKTDFPKVRRT